MAVLQTSGSYEFSQSAADIIASALRLCAIIADEETPTASQAQNCLLSLNAMVKGWQASGIHVWCEQECILFPQPLQYQYQLGAGSPDHACLFRSLSQSKLTVTAATNATTVTVASTSGMVSGDTFGVQLDSGVNFWTTISGTPVGSVVTLAAGLPSQATSGAIVFAYDTPLMRPLRVPAARRYLYSTGIQTPLITMARLDYDYLPNPINPGVVTQYFFDPQTGNGVYSDPISLFNLWPAPVDYTNAVRFVGQRPLQSFATLVDMPDFPAEWLAALKWNLALEIAPEYDVQGDRFDRLEKRAGYWLDLAKAWDREPESVFFGMAMTPGYR